MLVGLSTRYELSLVCFSYGVIWLTAKIHTKKRASTVGIYWYLGVLLWCDGESCDLAVILVVGSNTIDFNLEMLSNLIAIIYKYIKVLFNNIKMQYVCVYGAASICKFGFMVLLNNYNIQKLRIINKID